VAWTPALDAGSVDQTLGLLYQVPAGDRHGEAAPRTVWVPRLTRGAEAANAYVPFKKKRGAGALICRGRRPAVG